MYFECKLWRLRKELLGFERLDLGSKSSKCVLCGEPASARITGPARSLDRRGGDHRGENISGGGQERQGVSGSSLSTTAVWKIVLHYAHEVGIAPLMLHAA